MYARSHLSSAKIPEGNAYGNLTVHFMSSSTLFKLQLRVASPLNDTVCIISNFMAEPIILLSETLSEIHWEIYIKCSYGEIGLQNMNRNSWNTREYATSKITSRFECCLSANDCCNRSALQRRSQKAPVSLVIISDCIISDIMSDKSYKSFRSLYTSK